MTPTAERVALALIDSWNRRDLELFERLLSEEVSWYDPAMAHPPAVGRAAVMEFARSVLRAFPDFTFTLRAPICVSADGTTCAIPWRITATQVAPLPPLGLAPTGRRLSFEGVDLVGIQADRVRTIETFFDAIAAASQALKIDLRPRDGSISQWLMVGAQRIRAAWLRRSAPRGTEQE